MKPEDGYFDIRALFQHDLKHVPYIDVGLPAAACEFIRQHLHTAPTTLVPAVTQKWPTVTSNQVYNAWISHSTDFWRQDADHKKSLVMLLAEFG